MALTFDSTVRPDLAPEVPLRVDEIIAEEFAGKTLHGPVLLLAQHRANARLKEEGLSFAVMIEEVSEEGTLYVRVKAY